MNGSGSAAASEEQEEKRIQFHSTLVQITIYEMMLETQKVYFHERLASYLEKQMNETAQFNSSFDDQNSTFPNNISNYSNRNSWDKQKVKANQSSESIVSIHSVSDLNAVLRSETKNCNSVSVSPSELNIQGACRVFGFFFILLMHSRLDRTHLYCLLKEWCLWLL